MFRLGELLFEVCVVFALCHGARPIKEREHTISTQDASVISTGHLVSQHLADSKHGNHSSTLPAASTGYSQFKSPTLDEPLQQLAGFAQNAKDNVHTALNELGMHPKSRLDEYIGNELAAESNTDSSVEHHYTPEFERFYHERLQDVAEPILRHAQDMRNHSVSAWRAMQNADVVTDQMKQTLGAVGATAKEMDQQVDKETRSVANLSQNGFHAYNKYLESKPDLGENWKQIGKLTEGQLLEEGRRQVARGDHSDFWDYQLPHAQAGHMDNLKSRSDSSIYGKDQQEQNDVDTRANSLGDSMAPHSTTNVLQQDDFVQEERLPLPEV